MSGNISVNLNAISGCKNEISRLKEDFNNSILNIESSEISKNVGYVFGENGLMSVENKYKQIITAMNSLFDNTWLFLDKAEDAYEHADNESSFQFNK